MPFPTLLQRLLGSSPAPQGAWLRRRLSRRPRRRFVPRLEGLEVRTVPSTLTVLNEADQGSGSLRDTIATAMSGDTIVFAPSVHDIVLTSGQLAITQSLDIEGPRASTLTIERSSTAGTPSFRIFDIVGTGVPVTISHVTIANGLADGTLDPHTTVPGLGGGIGNFGGDLTLSHVVLSHNRAVGDATVGVLLTIYDAQGNPVQVLAHGIGAGGGIGNAQGRVSIRESTLDHNQAIGGDGSDFGIGQGGGIANVLGVVTITDSSLNYNQAIGGNNGSGPFFNGLGVGGAIGSRVGGGAQLSQLTIVDSTFSHNQAIGGNGNRGAGPGTGAGGAVDNGGLATILASTFTENVAQGGDSNTASSAFIVGGGNGFGGALLSATASSTPGFLTVLDSAVTGNRAQGGSNNQASAGILVTTIGVGGGGGVVNGRGSSATFSHSALRDNLAQGGDGNQPSLGALTSTGLGGGMVNGFGPSHLTLTDSTLSGNQAQGGIGATGNAGGDGWGGALVNDTGATVLFINSRLDHNQAVGGRGGDGGAGGNGLGGGVLNGTFGDDNPQANPFGLSTAAFLDSTLNDNLAQGGEGGSGSNGGNGLGGGLFNGPADFLTLTSSLVTDNHAIGGAVGAAGSSNGLGVGGGLYNLHSGAAAWIASVIEHNQASTSNDDIFTV